MGCRPNGRAREDRATPQFTCYPTSNAPVPLGSGCDANPPHVRRNVLKRKAAFRSSLSSPVCCVFVSMPVCEPPDSGARIWQSQQVMTEALVRSHPEPQRTPPFRRKQYKGRPIRPPQASLRACFCTLFKNKPSRKRFSHCFQKEHFFGCPKNLSVNNFSYYNEHFVI